MKPKKFIWVLLVLIVPFTGQANEAMSLSTYLNRVRTENLELKIEAEKLNAAEAGTVLNIPPPMVGVTQTKVDASGSGNGFEVSQAIPFPTKLSSDLSAKKHAAQAQKEMVNAQGQEILSQAKFLYTLLWINQEKLKLLEEKKQIIDHHVKLARSTARSDSFAKVHLLKAESDLDLLDNEIEISSQSLREINVQIAKLINADLSSFKIVAEEPPLSKIPELYKSEEAPQIRAAALDVETFKSKERQAKSEWLPDFNLRYKEMGQTSMTPKSTEVMVGVTLPFIFFWEPQSASRKASSERAQAEYELQKKKRSIEGIKETLSTRLESLKKRINLFQSKLIPNAETRMKLVRNIAPRDMEALQDHRETMQALPELKLQELELRGQFEESVSELEKYISHQGRAQ